MKKFTEFYIYILFATSYLVNALDTNRNEVRYKTIVQTRSVYRTVYTCCRGYRQENEESRPICDPGCLYGRCVPPNKCGCYAGFTGNTCSNVKTTTSTTTSTISSVSAAVSNQPLKNTNGNNNKGHPWKLPVIIAVVVVVLVVAVGIVISIKFVFCRRKNNNSTINENNQQFSNAAIERREEEIYASIYNPQTPVAAMRYVKGDDKVDISVPQDKETLNVYESVGPFQLNTFTESKAQQNLTEDYEIPATMIEPSLQSNREMRNSSNVEPSKEESTIPTEQRHKSEELQQQEPSVPQVLKQKNSESENKEIDEESCTAACTSNEAEFSKISDSTGNAKEHIYYTIDSLQSTTLETKNLTGADYNKLSFSKPCSADVKRLDSQILSINGAKKRGTRVPKTTSKSSEQIIKDQQQVNSQKKAPKPPERIIKEEQPSKSQKEVPKPLERFKRDYQPIKSQKEATKPRERFKMDHQPIESQKQLEETKQLPVELPPEEQISKSAQIQSQQQESRQPPQQPDNIATPTPSKESLDVYDVPNSFNASQEVNEQPDTLYYKSPVPLMELPMSPESFEPIESELAVCTESQETEDIKQPKLIQPLFHHLHFESCNNEVEV